ncbi:MAG: hypothetical protein JO015_08210 [Verrucomicrobia bacterium]|nr:hypothetical protein [Verrucomicrobiota bacterium]
MRIFIAIVALASFTFGSAYGNAVSYDITGVIDGTPGWPSFVGSNPAPFRLDFTLDTAHLTLDVGGRYLSITPTGLSYQVGGVKEPVTSSDVALQIASAYPQLGFDLQHGNDLLAFQFSVNASTSLNPLYTQLQSGPVLNTGTFSNLTLSRADILPSGTVNDIGLNISDARILVTPVPETSTFLLALVALAGIAGCPAARKLARRRRRISA